MSEEIRNLQGDSLEDAATKMYKVESICFFSYLIDLPFLASKCLV